MAEREAMKSEIYRTLLLLHNDPILIGTIEAWCAGARDDEVLADLHNWNEAKYLEMHEWLATLNGRDREAVQGKLAQYENCRVQP
jgi:hypothetical protein